VVLVGSIAYAHSFESLASRLGLSQGLAGAVVSPLFTSLPELVVFVTAVVSVGGRAGAEVGMGTVIGEPLMLSTLMTPLVVAASRGLSVDRSLARPYLVFVAVFPSVLLPPLLANHPWPGSGPPWPSWPHMWPSRRRQGQGRPWSPASWG